jgi:hypothetical protein
MSAARQPAAALALEQVPERVPERVPEQVPERAPEFPLV